MKEQIIKRFKEELNNKGINRPADLKKIIGSNYTTAQNYFHGKNTPSLEALALLKYKIGFDIKSIFEELEFED